MLSIQHILHSLYTYDMTYLHRYGASVVYPDAIRAYTNGSRKYSHFEHVFETNIIIWSFHYRWMLQERSLKSI